MPAAVAGSAVYLLIALAACDAPTFSALIGAHDHGHRLRRGGEMLPRMGGMGMPIALATPPLAIVGA